MQCALIAFWCTFSQSSSLQRNCTIFSYLSSSWCFSTLLWKFPKPLAPIPGTKILSGSLTICSSLGHIMPIASSSALKFKTFSLLFSVTPSLKLKNLKNSSKRESSWNCIKAVKNSLFSILVSNVSTSGGKKFSFILTAKTCNSIGYVSFFSS